MGKMSRAAAGVLLGLAGMAIPAGAANTLFLQPRNVSDDGPAAGVGFGSVSGTANLPANQYLEVSYTSDEANWGINIWTDFARTGVDPSIYLGGLHRNATEDTSVPLVWEVFDDTAAHNAAGAAVTDPPAGFAQVGVNWTSVKSKKDSDWTTQRNSGARILIGTAPNTAVIAQGTGSGASVATPVVVYLAGMFGSQVAPAGSYAADLGCDLYHE